MRPSLLEIGVIAIFIILLFGARKIPELMRGLGVGIREFKDGLRDKEEAPSKGTPNANANESKNSAH